VAATVPKRPVTCKVPSLTNHTKAGAKAMLRRAHCVLGKVTTPKKYKNRKGLVIRRQSRKAGTKTKAGAHVSVTLGVKPKPKHKTKHKH
jgi:beta-lactam-binding protein with PASTA domain